MIEANLQAAQFLGDRYEYTVALGVQIRVLASAAAQPVAPGKKVFLELATEAITLWPREE